MGKLIRRVGICLTAVLFFWCGSLIADRQRLDRDLIRLHIVAESNDAEDQANKLLVRDAVAAYIADGLRDLRDPEAAKTYVAENLEKIKSLADGILSAAGCGERTSVSFQKEAFQTREAEGYSIPAGIYQALRVTIGSGTGENWWCVAFPEACLDHTKACFREQAANAGIPASLTAALTGEEAQHLRFFLLEQLGKLEAFLCRE